MAWLQTYISGTLQNWAHRLELETDHTKIDDDLQDFPVYIHLSSEAGSNNVDTTNTLNYFRNFPGYNKEGLIAEYTMDSYSGNMIYDTSGYNNHGVSNGTMYIVNDGYFNNCTRAITYTTTRNITFLAPINYVTASFWIRRSDVTRTASPITKEAGDYEVVAIEPLSTGAQIYTYISPTSYFTDLTITDTDWHHIAMVQETPSTVRFYLDGVAASATVPWYDSMTRLGRIVTSSAQDCCSLCRMRFYDRELSLQEIQALAAEPRYRYKIAVATVSGTEHVETYCEVESWSYSDIRLWAKIPEISSTVDTKIYFYYDKRASDNTTYVGDTGSTVARNVWPSYNAVWHFNNVYSPSVLKNSAPTGLDGATSGMLQEAQLVTEIGPAFEFISGDYATIADNAAFDLTTNYTLEAFFNPHASTTVDEIICKAPNDAGGYQLRGDAGLLRFYSRTTGYAGNYPWVRGEWCYAAGVCETTTVKLFVDGALYDTGSTTGSPTNSSPFYIGRRWDGYYFDGYISEIRVSDTIRSPAWIKATNYALRDDLIRFESHIYKVSGYVYEQGEPVVRELYLYQDSTGAFMDSAISASSGYYELYTPLYENHYVVCKDDNLDLNYNHLIIRDVQLENA